MFLKERHVGTLFLDLVFIYTENNQYPIGLTAGYSILKQHKAYKYNIMAH